jgi:hypothetical protein
MAIPKQIDAQRDFSAGELDPAVKRRDDDDFVKKGMRQLSNGRTLNTGGVTNRPGRNLLAKRAAQARDEDVVISSTGFRLSFTNVTLTIYDTAGAVVATFGSFGWIGTNLGKISYAIYLKQIFICFPGTVPQVITWDGAATWTRADYLETVTAGAQKRTAFYRLSPKNITMAPSATTGTINVVFSAAVPDITNGKIAAGSILRYCGRQMGVAAVGSSSALTCVVNEPLPPGQQLGFAAGADAVYAAGDLIIGQTSGARAIVIAISPTLITVQVISTATSTVTQSQLGGGSAVVSVGFAAAEKIVGPGGALSNSSVSTVAPSSIAIWDEAIADGFRGFPSVVFADQNRIGFTGYPSLPGAVVWSALGNPTDLYPDATPQAAMLELAPGGSVPLYVVAGPDGSEFVFCDNATYYIPISPTNPLKPGSVQFQKIGGDGAGAVQPRLVGNVILYADQGLNQIYSIIATGAYSKPYDTQPLTDLHAHLFNNIQAIAIPTSVKQFAERYCYVLNGDGTVAVGKYALDKSGNIAGRVGWLPWNGFGLVKWVSALNDVVLFVTAYTQGGTTAFMLEQLDATLYLDASLPVNAIPTALTPPGGKGPLWWLPLATVDLMDGRLPLGPHVTDANGFILPNYPGEDLTSVTLRAGFMWTATWEPFLPAAQPGQDVGQRLKKRRARLQAYVMDSSGFRFVSLFNGERGPNRPTPGSIVGDKRIAAYNQDDDATQAPPLREQSYPYKPLGRSHDPRNAIMKDTPGPLTLVEIAARASV